MKIRIYIKHTFSSNTCTSVLDSFTRCNKQRIYHVSWQRCKTRRVEFICNCFTVEARVFVLLITVKYLPRARAHTRKIVGKKKMTCWDETGRKGDVITSARIRGPLKEWIPTSRDKICTQEYITATTRKPLCLQLYSCHLWCNDVSWEDMWNDGTMEKSPDTEFILPVHNAKRLMLGATC